MTGKLIVANLKLLLVLGCPGYERLHKPVSDINEGWARPGEIEWKNFAWPGGNKPKWAELQEAEEKVKELKEEVELEKKCDKIEKELRKALW